MFVATHRAKIDAFLGGVQLPAQTVQAGLAATGESDKYSKLHPGTPYAFTFGGLGIKILTFLSAVLLAIFPWISLLFTTFLILLLLAAERRRGSLETLLPISGEEKAGL